MEKVHIPPIYILSGGTGASGEQIVHTVLAQFPAGHVPVTTIPNIRRTDQIDAIIERCCEEKGILVHTLVDETLRRHLIKSAERCGASQIDLMGALLEKLTEALQQQPVGHPGLYRKLHQAYFERVEAIEYTMAHDDGKDPQGWNQAEIVLAGVSRVGKTPLSLYLSVLGWKVANAPLLPGIPPPQALFELDRRRVIGLTMEAGQLLIHRQIRQNRLGAPGPTFYTDPPAVHQEIQGACRMLKKHGITVLNVTDKPIETTADEVMNLMTRRLGNQSRIS